MLLKFKDSREGSDPIKLTNINKGLIDMCDEEMEISE